MFDEGQGENLDVTPNSQLDDKNLDPLLAKFVDSEERESIVNDTLTIPDTERLNFAPFLGAPKKEAVTILFPYQHKTEQCTLWTSAKFTTEGGYTLVGSVINPYYAKELVDRKRGNREAGINRGLVDQYKPTSSFGDKLGSALERTDYVLLDTVSVMLAIDEREEEKYLYVFQKYKVISGLNSTDASEILRLTVKRRNARTERFEDLRKFDEVPQEVLSVAQLDTIINRCKGAIEEKRRKDLAKRNSSQ